MLRERVAVNCHAALSLFYELKFIHGWLPSHDVSAPALAVAVPMLQRALRVTHVLLYPQRYGVPAAPPSRALACFGCGRGTARVAADGDGVSASGGSRSHKVKARGNQVQDEALALSSLRAVLPLEWRISPQEISDDNAALVQLPDLSTWLHLSVPAHRSSFRDPFAHATKQHA
jgi:hypothetical protein